jgi:hypothetical protein
MRKILRVAIGIGLMLTATALSIQGGLSRYARYGIPLHVDWRMIAVGLILLSAGGFVIRPDYFSGGDSGERHTGRRDTHRIWEIRFCAGMVVAGERVMAADNIADCPSLSYPVGCQLPSTCRSR